MKRTLVVILLIVFSLSSIGEAQRRRRRAPARAQTSAPVSIPCPANLNDITACPDKGCGGRFDANLNLRKNLRTDNQAPLKKDLQDLAALPDPVPGR